MGFGAGNVLASQVHGNLLKPAEDLCASVNLFGTTTEKLLIKHGMSQRETKSYSAWVALGTISATFFIAGKDIIHQQFLLNRMANSAIDIYAMACVLSRCSRSLNAGVESARHEELMTKVYLG